ncbi:MAG: phosphate/phosphite/phosphonate ABC transporter substrate-binding protein [Hyphomicrobiaceae bacterium]
MPNDLIANARMYSVAPGAITAWKRLFAWLDEASGVRLTVVDHAFPALLNDLWARPDLAATFMCGWPWLRHGATHRVVAAPVPSSAYARGMPQYCTHFVVHRDSPYQKLKDTFGHRFAYTIADSHSGYNAPRHHLMRSRGVSRRKLYGEIIGPLTTPRRMLEAIAEKRTDVGPLDSFAYDLLSRHEPSLAAETRVIASTDPVPIPAIMASRDMDTSVIEKLRDTLLTFGTRTEHASLCDDLCISGFATLDPSNYEVAERWAREAEAMGLEVIA